MCGFRVRHHSQHVRCDSELPAGRSPFSAPWIGRRGTWCARFRLHETASPVAGCNSQGGSLYLGGDRPVCRMKILFSATHFGFLRNFQSTIRLLAEQGHELHLLAERRDAIDGQKMADVLTAEHPSITVA